MTRQPEPIVCPTPGDIETLRAYLATGSVKRAAATLGKHEQTIKNSLARARRRAHVQTTAQLVVALSGLLTEH